MAQKKQVLLIAYLFPPIGGGGVQRAVKMARYLGEFGWRVHVLTVEPLYHATLDESLLEEIPEDVVIHRCREDEGLLNKLRPKPPGLQQSATDESSSVMATTETKQHQHAGEKTTREATASGSKQQQHADVETTPEASAPGSKQHQHTGEKTTPEATAPGSKQHQHADAALEAPVAVEVQPSRTSLLKSSLFQLMKKAKNAVLIPDDQILWYPAAKKMGLEIIQAHGIDAIVSTSGPYTNHLVGRYLKRKTGLPWIADFRDPWTQNMHRSGIRWRDWLEERMERSVHHEANMTLTVTHSFARNFNEKFGAAINRLEVIHNGYDPADYTELEHLQKAPADQDRCVFMYAGIFYQERNPRLLLRAVRELIDEGAIERQRILLRFAGVFDYPGYRENIDAVQELGLTDIVDIVGNLPHKQALAAMKRADVLLLVGDTAPESGSYIPGKLYEYLAVGHPILALSMPGESTKIIEKYGLGEVADPLSLEAVKAAVRTLIRNWEARQRDARAQHDGQSQEAHQHDARAQHDDQSQEAQQHDARARHDGQGQSQEAHQHDARARHDGQKLDRAASTLIYQRREQARRLAELLHEVTGSRR